MANPGQNCCATKLISGIDNFHVNRIAEDDQTRNNLKRNTEKYWTESRKAGQCMQKARIVKTAIFAILMTALAIGGYAAPRISVDVSKKKTDISPLMYGLFIEDINFAADGGLYPEQVKNRSFEFDRPMMGWRVLKNDGADGNVLIYRDDKNPKNPNYARITLNKERKGFALRNEGFRGLGIRDGAKYRFSLKARPVEGKITALRAEVVDSAGNSLGEGIVKDFTDGWNSYETELTTNATVEKAALKIWVSGQGKLDIDMVSLFPEDTYNGRKNGLRPDLVQMLADMKPGFLRFPGGCIVEGYDLSQRYQWKNTIGPLDQRVTTINRWNFEFSHRPTPDYFQSYGLGFYEYFQLAEDLGAEPMPILNCGMACQFNTGELVPMSDLQPYIQDALDLIEFANGPVDSKWGSVRAKMGHPKPFNMKLLGVGNEQWGPQYIERYKPFANAIKAKYPDIKLIAATGSDATIFPNGREEIKYLWKQWRKLQPDIVDEHFYRNPEWFLENVNYYDDYQRGGPELFIGEYGSQSVGVASPDNRNIWKTALYEAAFMIGMEHNADLVRLSAYAPLFAHLDAWQWKPDLIYFNNLKSFGSANYYVQKLFSVNKGTQLLETSLDNAPKINGKTQGLQASTVYDDNTGEVVIKVVNATDQPQSTVLDLRGAKKLGKKAKVTLLAASSLDDENTLAHPKTISPKESTASISGQEFSYEFQPLSLTILRIPVE